MGMKAFPNSVLISSVVRNWETFQNTDEINLLFLISEDLLLKALL